MTDLRVGNLVRVINPHSSVASVGDTGVVRETNTNLGYIRLAPVITKHEWPYMYWFLIDELEVIE